MGTQSFRVALFLVCATLVPWSVAGATDVDMTIDKSLPTEPLPVHAGKLFWLMTWSDTRHMDRALGGNGPRLGDALYAKVAVISAQMHAPSLVPVLVFDGPRDLEITEWMESHGVKVVFHRVPFVADLERIYRHNDVQFTIAKGQALRLELPLIAASLALNWTVEEVRAFPEGAMHKLEELEATGLNRYLCTDLDVLFLKDVGPFTLPRPEYFFAVKETPGPGHTQLNYGVGLFTTSSMVSIVPELIRFFSKHDFFKNDDQVGMKRFFVLNETGRMRDPFNFDEARWHGLNWRAYHGMSPTAKLVHFHGIKPLAVLQFAFQQRGWAQIPPTIQRLFRLDPMGVLYYSNLWWGVATQASLDLSLALPPWQLPPVTPPETRQPPKPCPPSNPHSRFVSHIDAPSFKLLPEPSMTVFGWCWNRGWPGGGIPHVIVRIRLDHMVR